MGRMPRASRICSVKLEWRRSRGMPERSQNSLFAADCPRCGQSRTTFDILGQQQVGFQAWAKYEAFLVCRNCFRSSIALLKQDASNARDPMSEAGHFANISFALEKWVFEVPNRRRLPNHVPDDVGRIFTEAASCAAIGAWDAAGTMFRKALDVATRSITPTPDAIVEPRPPNWKTYKDLRLRLDWLFEHQLLSPALRDLSSCIHQDGNDAAHDAAGLGQEEAEDLGDFSERVLEVLYTLPGQIADNQRRREERRGAIADQLTPTNGTV